MLTIFGAPGRYIQGPDALDTLGRQAALFGRRAALVIDGPMHAILGARVEAPCAASQVRAMPLIVEGDLTPETIEALRAQAGRLDADMVVAVGGGKALDAGKAVARSLHCHLITVPTAASNDAPTSKNYVLYDADHNLLAVEHMLFNPTIVLVDTTVIASAPAAFFRAGATPCPRSSRPSSAAATADPICMAASRPWPRNCWPRAACASCWKTAPRRWQRPAPAGPRRPSSARSRP